jgi:RHS repeat-associated protein
MRLLYRLQGASICMVLNRGCTNTDGEEVSGFFDYRNVSGEKKPWWGDFSFRTPQGIERYYKYKGFSNLFLVKERLLNGKVLCYNYKDTKLTSIEAKDPNEQFTYSKIRFSYDPEKHRYLAYTGTGREVHYKTSKRHYASGEKLHLLTDVSSPFYPQEKLRYNSSPIRSQLGRGNDFEATYDEDKISSLRLLGEEEALYQISYKNGTEVISPEGTKTIYKFNEDFHLKTVSTYDRDGSLRRKKSYTWDKNGRLQSIVQEGLCQREYLLDRFGNATQETLLGDLSGNGIEEKYTITRSFSEEPSFLIASEITEDTNTTITYLPKTNLVTSKTIKGRDGHTTKEYRKYDACYNLVEIIKEASGSKERTAFVLKQNNPGLHLPEWIEKFYYQDGVEHSLGKSYFHYNEQNLVRDEDVYDANGLFAYRLHKEYNSQDQVVLETNPLGQNNLYVYDDLQRLISHTPLSEKLQETMTYDRRGRLVSRTVAGKTTSYEYDKEDNLLVETNPLGHQKHFTYDLVTKKPTKISFEDLEESFIYDGYGRLLSKTDPLGRITSYTYNAYDNITEIRYPDETKESFRYYKNGKLKEHIDREGLSTSYIYDSFGRVTCKKWAGGEETFTYNSLHLLSYTDRGGYTTYYTYDGAGRKIQEEKCGRIITYSYDALGNLATTKQGNIITSKDYDLLGRVTLETKSDTEGHILFKKSILYDPEGNEHILTLGDKEETFFYDAEKRVIKEIGALGETTTIFYKEEDVLEKRSTDPSGVATVELFDSHDRLVERRLEKEAILSRERFTYDKASNLLSHEEDVFEGANYKKTLTNSYTYDLCNRRISSTVSNRTTSYTYTPNGKIATKTKSDGVILTYTYTALGEIETLCSSKGDIDYLFTYDQCGRLIQGNGFTRKLDPFGNILEESFGGLTVFRKYDDLDRLTTLTLPGLSPVFYDYDLYLKAVTYDEKKRTYEYDLCGNLLEESYGSYTRDKKGQIQELKTSKFIQKCSYDLLGNPTQIGETLYTYDLLSQLVAEKDPLYERTYSFNSHYEESRQAERLQANDPIGVYDSLDRLIECNGSTYTYDALDRRLSKNQEYFLYHGLEEIASYQNQKPIAIKIGLSHKPAFLLLKGTLTLPLYDAKGALKFLVDPDTEEIQNSYIFDAFGFPVEVIENLSNPWRYALKHHDAESGLIYFGKRYYNPTTKQWLTEDPAGNIDTLNFYAFVRNNPLRYVDYTGLFSEENESRYSFRQLGYGMLSVFNSAPVQGSLQAMAGFAELSSASALLLYSGGLGSSLGWPLLVHGTDHFVTGMKRAIFGTSNATATSQILQRAGMSASSAEFVDSVLNISVLASGAQIINKSYAPLTKVKSTVTVINEQKILQSAAEPYDKNLSQVAHALSKHAGRKPKIWGNLKGPMNTWHEQALKHLKDIQHAPGDFIKVTSPTTEIRWIHKRLPDGRGLRLNQDGTFKGFID